MIPFETALRQAIQDLTGAGARFALVGGLAVSVRTEPRFTRDADLAVAVTDDAEAEDLIRRLREIRYTVDAIVEQDAVGRLATTRLRTSGADVEAVIDLLFASSGIEPEIVAAAEPLDVLPRLRIPVARSGHLIALKVLARDDEERPQDLVDLKALLRVASTVELALAREALATISTRGFHRGRDLMQELRRVLA